MGPGDLGGSLGAVRFHRERGATGHQQATVELDVASEAWLLSLSRLGVVSNILLYSLLALVGSVLADEPGSSLFTARPRTALLVYGTFAFAVAF